MARRRILRALAVMLVFGIMLGLIIGGAQPIAVGLIPAPWDKLAHASVFACFAALLNAGLSVRVSLALLCAAMLGMADELHQSTLPGRFAGLDDLAADIIGAAIGLALVNLPAVQRLRQRLARP